MFYRADYGENRVYRRKTDRKRLYRAYFHSHERAQRMKKCSAAGVRVNPKSRWTTLTLYQRLMVAEGATLTLKLTLRVAGNRLYA